MWVRFPPGSLEFADFLPPFLTLGLYLMEMPLAHTIVVATHRALSRNIDMAVRTISIDATATHYHIRVYFDREPTEDDFEIYQIITTEIAADFPQMVGFKEELLYSLQPLEQLEHLGHMVFERG